jgi:hypothetical protein
MSDVLRRAAQAVIEAWDSDGPTSTMEDLRAAIAQQDEKELVAWDWFHARVYGAPGETRHNVLWVADYRLADGTTPDLDYLLDVYRAGGLAEARTIYVRALYADRAT